MLLFGLSDAQGCVSRRFAWLVEKMTDTICLLVARVAVAR